MPLGQRKYFPRRSEVKKLFTETLEVRPKGDDNLDIHLYQGKNTKAEISIHDLFFSEDRFFRRIWKKTSRQKQEVRKKFMYRQTEYDQ